MSGKLDVGEGWKYEVQTADRTHYAVRINLVRQLSNHAMILKTDDSNTDLLSVS